MMSFKGSLVRGHLSHTLYRYPTHFTRFTFPVLSHRSFSLISGFTSNEENLNANGNTEANYLRRKYYLSLVDSDVSSSSSTTNASSTSYSPYTAKDSSLCKECKLSPQLCECFRNDDKLYYNGLSKEESWQEAEQAGIEDSSDPFDVVYRQIENEQSVFGWSNCRICSRNFSSCRCDFSVFEGSDECLHISQEEIQKSKQEEEDYLAEQGFKITRGVKGKPIVLDKRPFPEVSDLSDAVVTPEEGEMCAAHLRKNLPPAPEGILTKLQESFLEMVAKGGSFKDLTRQMEEIPDLDPEHRLEMEKLMEEQRAAYIQELREEYEERQRQDTPVDSFRDTPLVFPSKEQKEAMSDTEYDEWMFIHNQKDHMLQDIPSDFLTTELDGIFNLESEKDLAAKADEFAMLYGTSGYIGSGVGLGSHSGSLGGDDNDVDSFDAFNKANGSQERDLFNHPEELDLGSDDPFGDEEDDDQPDRENNYLERGLEAATKSELDTLLREDDEEFDALLQDMDIDSSSASSTGLTATTILTTPDDQLDQLDLEFKRAVLGGLKKQDIEGVTGAPSIVKPEYFDGLGHRKKGVAPVAKGFPDRKDSKGRTYGLGKRKQSVARAYIWPVDEGCAGGVRGAQQQARIMVNQRDYIDYVGISMANRLNFCAPFLATNTMGKFHVRASVKGGGFTAQGEAVRLAIARALQWYSPEYKAILRKKKMVTADPRFKEAKKPGRIKARKRTQFNKR